MGSIESDEGVPSRGIILLSGFVFPGVGQLLQRRWLVGILFGGVFCVFFLLLLFQCFRTVMAFYRMGLSDTVPEGELPSVVRLLGLLGTCLLVHVVNIGDVYLAYRRGARRRSMRRHFSSEIVSLLEEED